MANEDVDDGRLRRVETRVTKLCLALGIDPNKSYDLNHQTVMVDARHREIVLPHMDITLLDMANAITAEGAELNAGWSLVLRDRTIGTLSFA